MFGCGTWLHDTRLTVSTVDITMAALAMHTEYKQLSPYRTVNWIKLESYFNVWGKNATLNLPNTNTHTHTQVHTHTHTCISLYSYSVGSTLTVGSAVT